MLDLRVEFQAAMSSDASAVVEDLTGRTVIAMMGADHIGPDLAAEVFVLDAPPAGDEEEEAPDQGSDTSHEPVIGRRRRFTPRGRGRGVHETSGH